ncbi:hypothetical protein Tco_1149381 [Tanacetum coccineum]
MQEGLDSDHEHGVARRSLSVVDAYNPKVASADYVNAVKALEDVHFPLVDLLKSKKDAGMDEVLDCFLLDRPLAELLKAASLQPCIRSFLFLFIMLIVSAPLSSQTWVGEASISATPLSVEDYVEEDTDEALGSVVVVPILSVVAFSFTFMP